MAHDIPTYPLLVDGALRPAESGALFESVDPSTGRIHARFADAGKPDADAALSAARRAFDTGDWVSQGRAARVRTVRAFVEGITSRLPEFIDMEIRDAGHTARLANLFTVPLAVEHARQILELFEASREVEPLPQVTTPALAWNYRRREPVGVCSLISPFNFPLLITMWKVAPALATGCTAVLKPSPLAPGSAALLAEVAADLLPAGVLNVVTTSSLEVAQVLTTSELVDKVAFTGSTGTGRRIMRAAADTVKNVTLELGGKGATVLLDDADLDIAVPGALWGCFLHQGQACESGTRLLVPQRRYDEVCERLVDLAGTLVVGPAGDFGSDLGPLISATQRERVSRYIASGLEEGAQLIIGGGAVTGEDLGEGFYVAPTVFAGVTNGMTIAREEIFGPVLSVLAYDGDAEAVALANDSVYGLACSVWSRDIPRAVSVGHRLRTGTVWVNDVHLLNGYAPFGGYKQSGVGRELGPESFQAYLETKHVHVDQTPTLDQKFWYGVLGLT
jgi:aldehyde dehydrogenase (NAD+)